MQRSALCRSPGELSNAYLLAKFCFDTAENEPCKICRSPCIHGMARIQVAHTGPAAPGSGARRAPRRTSGGVNPVYIYAERYLWPRGVGESISKISKIFCKFLAGSFSAVSKRNFARKYAFDSIFQALQDLHPFAPLQSQNFSKNSVWKNQQFSWKFSNNFANAAKVAKFAKFQNLQVDNLVDFEECCKTRIYLQRSAPIQPKTSEFLPKFCQKLATTLRVDAATFVARRPAAAAGRWGTRWACPWASAAAPSRYLPPRSGS